MSVDLATYGGLQRPMGYAGDLVDETDSDVVSMLNSQAISITPGNFVAWDGGGVGAGKGSACMAPVADVNRIVGIAKRYPIRPADYQTDAVNFKQYDTIPVIRKGFVYMVPVENVTEGDVAVSITAQNGAPGSSANNANAAGNVAVSVPAAASAVGKVTMKTIPANTDTITIAATAVEFVTVPAGGSVSIAAGDIPTTVANLLAFLLASNDANIKKCTYAAVDGDTASIAITSVDQNTGANALTLAVSAAGKWTLSGAKLTGGLGNVGNGVLTPNVATPVLDGAATGAYRVVCVAAAGGGGTFRVYDPTGNEFAADFAVGATFQTQVKFAIAAGDADFVVGDEILVTVQPYGNAGRVAVPSAIWQTTTAVGQLGIVRILQ
jgi:hypothetical protein